VVDLTGVTYTKLLQRWTAKDLVIPTYNMGNIEIISSSIILLHSKCHNIVLKTL
jgi:hypothetical protein